MDSMTRRCWAEIDLGAIENNYRTIRASLPAGCGFVGVVKANAYGHGAVRVSSLLQDLGAEYLAVASLDEALHLREAGITAPVLILGWTPPSCTKELLDNHITQAVGDRAAAAAYLDMLADAKRKLKIHVKLETGMGRTGFSWSDAQDREALLRLLCSDSIDAEGVFTHFAVSDEPEQEFTRLQMERFSAAVSALEKEAGKQFRFRHCSNSGAVLFFPEYDIDLVRPGIALYGHNPSGERSSPLPLRPAMTLKARIAMVKEHQPGDTISYGRTFTAEHPMRVAVATIGYADGLPRSLSGRFNMIVNGSPAPQIGRICMDMCMLDVTDLPSCQPGDEVTVFGGEGESPAALAERCGTISYELLCAVSDRVPRVYPQDRQQPRLDL